MAKVLNYEYLRLTVIDKKTELVVSFKALIEALEKKPLDISQENHRYQCKEGICSRAFSHIKRHDNGVLVSFARYDRDELMGSFLKNGDVDYSITDQVKAATQRDDIALKEYNRVKVFCNGIVVFQKNQKANSALQFREYLHFHFKDIYTIELVPIYLDDLFQALDNGEIQNISLTVGFAPQGSFDAFESENYTGATTCQIKFKAENEHFLKKSFFVSALTKKALEKFGVLNSGTITNAKAKLSNRKAMVSLEQYQLRDQRSFTDITSYLMDPNKYFDEMYNKHKNFLDTYTKRDGRYD
ncbi:hypothetical protein [Sulfurimonas sp.]|uniref:hypothetical protein n=1 Tax=Sulfurimonas sp. TaxID=2022749 RepID=UPI001A0DA6BB|nr:hypothetical protein [Sulfurimonas sp.]MBE0515587.1 hypothetical protein [Sulfurimonas sp.]